MAEIDEKNVHQGTDGLWYFKDELGEDNGPFVSPEAANNALSMYCTEALLIDVPLFSELDKEVIKVLYTTDSPPEIRDAFKSHGDATVFLIAATQVDLAQLTGENPWAILTATLHSGQKLNVARCEELLRTIHAKEDLVVITVRAEVFVMERGIDVPDYAGPVMKMTCWEHFTRLFMLNLHDLLRGDLDPDEG